MKLLNKIKIALGILAVGYSVAEAQLTISVVSPSTNGVFTVTTNRASVYQIEVTSTSSGVLSFYDADSIAAPVYGTNYTNGQFVTRITYPTNYVYSFVGYNGFTNWYTNVGIWTVNLTNAASTNPMNPLIATVVTPNTYIIQNVDALFIRGITCYSTATNSSIVVNYRTAK